MKKIKFLFLMLLGAFPVLAQESGMVYYEGTVTDQDGNAVAGASVCVYNGNPDTGVRNVEYKGVTDANGNYSIKVEESDLLYNLSIESNGYPCYLVNKVFSVKEGVFSFFPAPKDITLWNRLEFKKDQRATIIMPEAPNPNWGRFYRIDSFENSDIIFKRENEPKANVPYVIFPNEDFSIDISGYNYSGIPAPDSVILIRQSSSEWYGFCGSYCNTDFLIESMIRILDESSDSWNGLSTNSVRIGAFRAYLVVPRYSMNYVFEGGPTSISSMTSTSRDPAIFDLQGRRILGEPKHGMYIQNGKKVMR